MLIEIEFWNDKQNHIEWKRVVPTTMAAQVIVWNNMDNNLNHLTLSVNQSIRSNGRPSTQ